MKISTFTLIPVLLTLVPGIAPASERSTPIYRVEVIVLAHLDGQSDRYRIEQPGDYSSLTDPLLNARQAAWVEPETDPDPEADPEVDEFKDDTGPVQSLYPPAYINLDQLGPEMRGAWQRLEDSARHRALTWRAWHQPLSRQVSTDTVRIHDDQLMQINGLDLEHLLGRPDKKGENDNALGLVAALMPQISYRLDGGVRIRQRQFIHADIEIIWHEPLTTSTGPLAPEHRSPGNMQVHRINQSRTIRPQRLEYFDSDWLGVLIWIEPWESPIPGPSPGGERAQGD